MTLSRLSERTGATQRTLKKALAMEGLMRKGKKRYPETVLPLIIPHLKRYQGPEPTGGNGLNVDKVSGLTWPQLLTREKAIETQRLNEEDKAVRESKWMLTDTVMSILRAVVTRLEGFPAKVRSEAGLSDSQGVVLAANVDDLRSQIANDITQMSVK